MIVGHRNNITKMAELYRISIGNPLPHLQLIDDIDNDNNDNDNDNDTDTDDNNKTINKNINDIIKKNKYLEIYINKLYHSVLYQPFDKIEYFKLCKKYIFTNFIPIKKNRKTSLNNDDIILASKYLFSSKLQKMINIFIKNNNDYSLFYILKAIELRYFFICNAWNGRPKSYCLTDELSMQYQWNSNMKHNLIPSILNTQNNKVINQITQNNQIENNLKQRQFIKYTNNPILSGSITQHDININIDDDDDDQDDDDISVGNVDDDHDDDDDDQTMNEDDYDENGKIREIKPARMGSFCIPQFDISIIVKNKTKSNKSNDNNNNNNSKLIHKTEEAIVMNFDSTNLSQREHEWRINRESSRINPWIRGDICMIFADQISMWLEGKITKIYDTDDCKVDIYSKQLRWPKYRTYGGLSQFIMPKINKNIDIENINDIPLIDRLENGMKIKL